MGWGGLREFVWEGKLKAAQDVRFITISVALGLLRIQPRLHSLSASEIEGEEHPRMHTMRDERFVDAPLSDISYHV